MICAALELRELPFCATSTKIQTDLEIFLPAVLARQVWSVRRCRRQLNAAAYALRGSCRAKYLLPQRTDLAAAISLLAKRQRNYHGQPLAKYSKGSTITRWRRTSTWRSPDKEFTAGLPGRKLTTCKGRWAGGDQRGDPLIWTAKRNE